MRISILVTATVLALFLGMPLYASQSSAQVVVVQSSGEHYTKVRQLLAKRLAVQGTIQIGNPNSRDTEVDEERLLAQDAYFVAIGSGATRFLATRKPEAKVLSILVTKSSFRKAMEQNSKLDHDFVGQFIDQPFERYLVLAQLLLPDINTVATLSAVEADRLTIRNRASSCGLTLNTNSITESSKPIAVFNNLYASSDAMILAPQLNPLNGNIAKWTLHIGARHRKPVIGFSEKLVTAGALAAIYASAEDIARDAADTIQRWSDSGFSADNKKTQQNARFTVSTNQRVAEFLGLSIPANEALRDEITSNQSRCLRRPKK